MTTDFKIDPRVTEFVEHIEIGLNAAGLNFEDYLPQYVQLEHEDNKEIYSGLIFSQESNPIDSTSRVCVTPEGVHFYGSNASKLPFNFDQSPSRVAILFLVAMIKGDIIDPPSCPHCEEKKQ